MTVDREAALAGALDQIAAAFGKDECLTPKQREMRGVMRMRDLKKRIARRVSNFQWNNKSAE